jgi:putative pre-16S rRNA nuclease
VDNMRVMGLDIGSKRIGVAISDETGTLAQGRCFIERVSDATAVAEIKRSINENDIKELVVGNPLLMSGDAGERSLDAQKMADLIEKSTGLKAVLFDERFSTKEAESVMILADISRKKRKKVIDKMAAQIILQNYLDMLKGS